MLKTSLYLPERLKANLARRAKVVGRSEAELIRDALQAYLQEPAPAARGVADQDPAIPGRLVGIGVGPGEPDLLTVRALRALRRADIVIAPTTAPDAVGRAETVVRQAVPEATIERVVFTMSASQSGRRRSVTQAARAVVRRLDAGEEVAWVTLGDPLTYSTFASVSQLVRHLRPASCITQVPGIMAFQALAAMTGVVLADGESRIVVRTAADRSVLERELEEPDTTLVVYKGGRRLPELADAAGAAGRDREAVAGELLGLPGERVGPLRQLAAAGPASYLATVIVPTRAATRSVTTKAAVAGAAPS